MPGRPLSRVYVVRDAGPSGESRHPDQLRPYTLRGLLDAIADARLRSRSGTPQELYAREPWGWRLLRRYEDGRQAEA